jgi:hypothetical protein
MRDLAIDRPALEALCKRWYIRRLSLLDAPQGTDFKDRLSLLVEFERAPALLALVEAELAAAFDSQPIHLVAASSLPPKARALVAQSAKALYVGPRRWAAQIIAVTLVALFIFGLAWSYFRH